MGQSVFLFQKQQQIAHYTVVFPIKQSAYAETYRVRKASGKLCFLKLICLAKLQSFQLNAEGSVVEIELIKYQNQHPNLCKYIDDGILICKGQKYAYFVTDFVSGETIAQRITREQGFSVYETKQIALSILSVLQYLHLQTIPIIHNEITIQNVLLDLTGNLSELKLIDFGHAQRLVADKTLYSDIENLNLFYLAPERFNGLFSVQSDLYSVGVVIYYLLFGVLPYFIDLSNLTKEEQINCIFKERKKPLKLPNIELFELDNHLINIIEKALDNDITKRFQSADEFRKALNEEIEIKPKKSDKNQITFAEKEEITRKGNGFGDVAGMSELKKLLYTNVINILRNTEKAKKYKLSIPNGMLLYGPPGCGKSFFAEKFAEETGHNYIYVKSSDLASIYVHGSQEKIGKLFDEARKKAPTILCFDEFDSLVPNRDMMNNSSQSGEVNEFLTQLNNCGMDKVFVIASTNKPDLIDPAVLRRGRIDKIIYLPVPDKEARSAMFQLHLNERPVDLGIDYEYLANLTDYYVSSDIAFIVNEAAIRAAQNDEKITQLLLEAVVSENNPSVKSGQLAYYEELRDKLEGFSKQADRPRIGFKK